MENSSISLDESKANRLQSFVNEEVAITENNIDEELPGSSSESGENEPVINPAEEIIQASMRHTGEHSVQKKTTKSANIFWVQKALNNPSSKSKLRIFAITWNMFGKPPPEDISLILPKRVDHHLIIVCTQECLRSIGTSLFYSSKKPWEQKLKESLGDDYELYAANTIGATHLAIFMNINLKGHISNPALRKVSTGFGNVVKNKGAVGVQFTVGKTSILIVGCHLASGQNAVSKRNNDFRRIEKELFKEISTEPASELFDATIYLGDLNYRVNGKKEDVEFLIGLDIMEPLRKGDQLLIELSQNTAFAGFCEGKLSFDPTYKYDTGTSIFDNSKKQRVPSWTDRILFKCKNSMLKQKNYGSLLESFTSDHRPVFSQFILDFQPGKDAANKSSNSRTCLVF